MNPPPRPPTEGRPNTEILDTPFHTIGFEIDDISPHQVSGHLMVTSQCFQVEFLVEIGAFDVLKSDMYRKLAEDRSRYGCSWESFEVCRHQKYLGYIVGRHGILWSSKNFKPDATVEEGSGELDLTKENHHRKDICTATQ